MVELYAVSQFHNHWKATDLKMQFIGIKEVVPREAE